MTDENQVEKSKMADIFSSKQTRVGSKKVARRLGRSRPFSMRFFLLAREKMRLSHESDLKLNRQFFQKLFGKRSRKFSRHFHGVLNVFLIITNQSGVNKRRTAARKITSVFDAVFFVSSGKDEAFI